MGRPSILIVGASVRAFAESAARAGYAVTGVDAYADLDTTTVATVRRVTPYSADAAVAVAASAPSEVVAYTSNFENHPAALRRLAHGRELWGNTPDTLATVRAPITMAATLEREGVSMPRVRARPPRAASAEAELAWLLKPRASGGGHGVVRWTARTPVPRPYVLQEQIRGQAGSILFVADGRASVPFAVTRQLVGDRRFGAAPFRYCGTMLAPADDPRWGTSTPVARAAARLASIATRAFQLIGVNGIDVIVTRRGAVPIEINPRCTAAMEVVERRDGFSVFDAHVAGCTHRLSTVAPSGGNGHLAAGKAIVFARRDCLPGDLRHWLRNPDVRDIPNAGTPIPRGAPICTVFATAPTTRECHDRLVARAAWVYDALG